MMKKLLLCLVLSALSQQVYGDSDIANTISPVSHDPIERKYAASLGYSSISYWNTGFGKALEPSAYGITFNGFVKADYFYDTRKSYNWRDGAILFFPLPKNNHVPTDVDAKCCDINKDGQFNFLAIQTQLGTLITGPDIFNACVRAYIEADFAGAWSVNGDVEGQEFFDGQSSAINSLWLRHAFVQFDWNPVSLLLGQFWHPMLPRESASMETVSWYALPFEAVARNPQIRLTIGAGEHAECIIAALSQVDFVNNGPITFSARYLRNAMPNLHGQMRFFCNEHILGMGVDFKRLQPRESIMTLSGATVKTSAKVDSVSALAYAEFFCNEFDAKFKFIYGSNLHDQGMIGGYGVSFADPKTGARCYTPIRNLSYIADFCLKRKVEPGIFIGFTKNIGSDKQLFDMSTTGLDPLNNVPLLFGKYEVYGLDDNLNGIDSVFGVSPRVKWHIAPVTFAAELRYLRAVYAPMTIVPSPLDPSGYETFIVNSHGRACGPDQRVNMIRFIASAYYWF